MFKKNHSIVINVCNNNAWLYKATVLNNVKLVDFCSTQEIKTSKPFLELTFKASAFSWKRFIKMIENNENFIGEIIS